MKLEGNMISKQGVEDMFKVDQNTKLFIKAIEGKKAVVCGLKGKWHVEGKLMQSFRHWFGLEASRLIGVSRAFCSLLDSFEKIPIKFNGQAQDVDFSEVLSAASSLREDLEKFSSLLIQEEKGALNRRILGLQYRLGKCNGGLEQTDPQQDTLKILTREALLWKQQHPLMGENAKLSQEDHERLQQAARYAEAVKLILSNENIKNSFMLWVIRDKITPAPFIEFPAMQEKMVDCSLNGRIGRMGGEDLKIVTTEFKDLVLKMEGKPVSLLDDDRVVEFRGHYKLKVSEILEIFKNKKYRVGNLEFMADGIINWNEHHLGWWDTMEKRFHQIDLGQKKWWDQLPKFEGLSLQQARKRYGWHLNGKNWNVAASATRGTPTLDFDQTHAFIEVAIPREDGSYGIYDFGKFAFVFPSTFFECFMTFCHTVHATVAFPDENVFYTQRQHMQHSFAMTQEEGMKLMDSIKSDMIKSRELNFVFQIQSENCAKWTHLTIAKAIGNHRMPNLFQMPLLNTEPVGFVAVLFRFIKKLPEKYQVFLLTRLHLLIGAWKETIIIEDGQIVIKSLSRHEFWETGFVYLPAFLHKQIERGVLVVESKNHSAASESKRIPTRDDKRARTPIEFQIDIRSGRETPLNPASPACVKRNLGNLKTLKSLAARLTGEGAESSQEQSCLLRLNN